ncbi:MAG: nucleotidyltransferase domain-containing protein [ANME-2 cluster archaeon]|nr:nucleotidyltransferase domain-containing protein [ANME-2 cluster archaeon]
MKNMIGKIDDEINETIEILKGFDNIHSIILFGSRARGVQGKDIDLCIIPSKEPDQRERLSIESIVPDNVDISVFLTYQYISEKGYLRKVKCCIHEKCTMC